MPLNRLRLPALLVCLALAFGTYYLVRTAGFIDLAATQKRDTQPLGPLDRDHGYAQHFTAGESFLSRVELGFRTSGSVGESAVTLRLRDESGKEIAARSTAIPAAAGSFRARLEFKPQRDSSGGGYELVIETDAPPGMVSVMGSEYDAYPERQLLRNGLPLGQDVGFFAYSRPAPFDLIAGVLDGSWFRLAALLLISALFGGLGLVAALALRRSSTLIELAAFSLTLGVSIPPLLLFLLSAAGLRLSGGNMLAALLLLAAGFAAWAAYSRRNQGARRPSFRWQPRESIFLLILLVIALFTRLAQVNDLLVPSGTGGLAHQRILQRIVNREQIPLDSIYHTGFHSNVYLLHRLTGAGVSEAALLFGQWLNVISGLSLYLLARRVLKQPRYALAAAAAWWFLAPIPALLFNWGRYPFLQGMVLLPVALGLLLTGQAGMRGGLAMPALLLAGLFLSHYGLFAIFCILALAALLSRGVVNRADLARSRPLLLAVAVISLPLLVILIAKADAVLNEGTWLRFFRQDALAYTASDYGHFFSHTLKHGGPLVWILGAAGFVLLCWRTRRTLLISLGVVAVLLLLDAAQLLLFHHSASRPANLLYMLFLPLCILLGFALKSLFQRTRWVTAAFTLFAFLIGAYNISGSADPVNVFFTTSDARAMDWIKTNTPPGSIFLVNSYPYDGEYQPEDGGGWIPYLTGREIIFLDSPADFEQPARSIERAGADYIYIGSGYGPLAFPVVGDPDYPLLYSRSGRFIFRASR